MKSDKQYLRICDWPEYKVRAGMIQRCTNPKSGAWERYGGRGIKVCDRWLQSAPKMLVIERRRKREGSTGFVRSETFSSSAPKTGALGVPDLPTTGLTGTSGGRYEQ